MGSAKLYLNATYIQMYFVSSLPALLQYVVLDIRERKIIRYLWDLYKSNPVPPTESSFAHVVQLPLLELLCGMEEVDLSEMLASLMFKGQSKSLGVAVQFHLITVSVA